MCEAGVSIMLRIIAALLCRGNACSPCDCRRCVSRVLFFATRFGRVRLRWLQTMRRAVDEQRTEVRTCGFAPESRLDLLPFSVVAAI